MQLVLAATYKRCSKVGADCILYFLLQVNRVMTADALMLCSGLIMHLSGNFWVARKFVWLLNVYADIGVEQRDFVHSALQLSPASTDKHADGAQTRS